MPKTKISEFDSVAANNTDIDGINLGEGMLPSDVNNAIRELMAQIKELQAGTSGDTIPIAAGGTGATTAAAARTALGATTLGANIFTVTNPSAITFPRFNANNTISLLNAADFRTAIGAGSGAGTVTSVAVSGGTTGLTTSGGPITTSGTITLAGTLAVANGGTGITSFGAGVATFLGTPSSANLAAAVTNGTGSGALVFATSPTLVTPALGTPTSGTLSGCTVDGTDAVGFRNIPQNSRSANYTLVLTDSGKHIFHPSADTSARTWTIPANSSVPFPIGTAVTFINQNGAGVITIDITSDTMRLAGAGTTGNRTLAANGIATAIKVTSTEWIISGTGLT